MDAVDGEHLCPVGLMKWRTGRFIMPSDPRRKDGSMQAEGRLKPVKDASHLYEVERRDRHAERPGFRISELQLSPTQTVPWHFHTNISDTFYVLEGQMRLFLQNPK